jgi:Family of unknown function (DUF5681)
MGHSIRQRMELQPIKRRSAVAGGKHRGIGWNGVVFRGSSCELGPVPAVLFGTIVVAKTSKKATIPFSSRDFCGPLSWRREKAFRLRTGGRNMKSELADGSSGSGVGRGNHNLGNEFGFNTRFPKGKSGNPGGRPSRTPYTDAVRIVADLKVSEMKIKPTDPVPLAIAKRLVKDALGGKTQAAAELAKPA